jgi:hypothetical protein
MYNGEKVAVSTNHNSNFTAAILDQHYLEGGFEGLRYDIIFGNEVNITVTFSFNKEIFENCTQAWINDNLEMDLNLSD